MSPTSVRWTTIIFCRIPAQMHLRKCTETSYKTSATISDSCLRQYAWIVENVRGSWKVQHMCLFEGTTRRHRWTRYYHYTIQSHDYNSKIEIRGCDYHWSFHRLKLECIANESVHKVSPKNQYRNPLLVRETTSKPFESLQQQQEDLEVSSLVLSYSVTERGVLSGYNACDDSLIKGVG